MSTAERIAEVIWDHWPNDESQECVGGEWIWVRRCDCGFVGRAASFATHVAAALVESGVIAEAQAEALREAAKCPDAEYDWEKQGRSGTGKAVSVSRLNDIAARIAPEATR